MSERSPRKKIGIKRPKFGKSPKKVKKVRLTTPVKKEKLQKIYTSDDDRNLDPDESDMQDGEDEEIDWQKLEEELERNAAKANLTTINVKSILHHILSDKRVIELAQRVDKDPNDANLGDVFGETKLTRSKARALGYQPLPLPCEEEPKATILDVEFSESSSSDEEYHPQADEEEPISDEELSALSDFHSETQSPSSSSFNTVRKSRGLSETLSESDNSFIATPERGKSQQSLLVPMEQSFSKDKDQVVFAVPDLPNLNSTIENEEDLIASRTRSRFPMPNVEVEEIAALFKPPDCAAVEDFFIIKGNDDPDEVAWKMWLSDLAKPMKALNDTGDDDANDEDFNYMQEVDEEDTELEHEELRNDKTTRVTQKELKDLFNELLLGYEDDEYTYCENWAREDTQIRAEEEMQPKSIEAAESLELTFTQRDQIVAQMQQHVQLLTQFYMTTCTIQELKEEAKNCKRLVEELNTFQNKAIQNSNSGCGHLKMELSSFCMPGISDAYRIIQSLQGSKIRCGISKVGKESKIPISDTMVNIFAKDPYFATYIELLPDQGMESFQGKRQLPRMKFTKSEDNLLALGLEQFKGQNKYENIRDNLLPTWTAKQLANRTKNLSSRIINNANPVAIFKKYKVLPELEAKVKINVPREISKVPLISLPRTVWKGRLIPFWFYKVSKKLQLERNSSSHMENVKSSSESITNGGVRPAINASSQQNSYNNIFNQSSDPSTFYGSSASTVSTVNAPPICGNITAPAAPVLVVPPPVVYQPMPMPMPIVGGYAMVPMMYCPVVSAGVGGVVPANFSTPKSIVNSNNCFSEPPHHVNRQLSPHVLTPVGARRTASHSADRAKHVKRALNYNKTSKNDKKKKKKRELHLETNDSENCNPTEVEKKNHSQTSQTFTSIVSSSQSSSKTMCTPVKSIMSEFGISTLSSDSFNIPFMSLIKDLPSPSSFPHLLISPSKPLRETSLPDVKHVLTTPQKIIPEQDSCMINELQNSTMTQHKTDDQRKNSGVNSIFKGNVITTSCTLGKARNNPVNVVSTNTKSTAIEFISSCGSSNKTSSWSSNIFKNKLVKTNIGKVQDNNTVVETSITTSQLTMHCTMPQANRPESSTSFIGSNTFTSSTVQPSIAASCTGMNKEVYTLTSTKNIEPVTSVPQCSLAGISISKAQVGDRISNIKVSSLSSGNNTQPTFTNSIKSEQPASFTQICNSSSNESSDLLLNKYPSVDIKTLNVSEERINISSGQESFKQPLYTSPNGTQNVHMSQASISSPKNDNLSSNTSSSNNQATGNSLNTHAKCVNSPEENKNIEMLPKVCSSNDVGTGDDESSLDAPCGGMDSQTDDNASADDTPEKKLKKVKGDVGNVKAKDEKKPTKVRRKLKQKRKNVFNLNEKMQEKRKGFAHMYIRRIGTALADDPELFEKFIHLMQEGMRQQLSKLQTYHKVADLLKDYPDLVDNYSGFLDQHEARYVGKFMHWLKYDQIINFHLSCEEYFFNTPGWYMKIVLKILDVTEKETNSEKIFNAVIPMFRGNQKLTNQFRRLFLDLTPPPCSDDEFEVIDFGAVTSGAKELDDFDEIQFQPPDTAEATPNEFSKGKSKTGRRGKKSKYTKKKSSTNITASKLRELASKRKKNKVNTTSSTDIVSDEVNNAVGTEIVKSIENNCENHDKNLDNVSKQPSSDNVEVQLNSLPTKSSSLADVGTNDVCNVVEFIARTTAENITDSNHTNIMYGDVPSDNSNRCGISSTNLQEEVELPVTNQAPSDDKNDNKNDFATDTEYRDDSIAADTVSTLTVPSVCESFPSTKRPIQNNIVPFKAMRTDINYSFFESSNSQSGNSQSEYSQLEGKVDVQNDVTAVVSAGTCVLNDPSFQSLLPYEESYQVSSGINTEGDAKCSTITKNESENLEDSKKDTSQNLSLNNTQKNDIFVSASSDATQKDDQQHSMCPDITSSDGNMKENAVSSFCILSTPSCNEVDASKCNELASNDGNSLLNVPLDKNAASKLSQNHHNLSHGDITVGQDLTFQENSILTNHDVTNVDVENQLPVSSLSFTGMLESVLDGTKSNDTPVLKCTMSNSGLMGPPTQVTFCGDTVKDKVTVTEKSASNNQITSDNDQVQLSPSNLSFSGKIIPMTETCVERFPESNDSTNMSVSAFPTNLSFTGKITPISISTLKRCVEESPKISSDSLEYSITSSEIISFGKSPLYTAAGFLGTTTTSTEQSQSICSQRSVDIDFKVGKISDLIEISSDTLQRPNMIEGQPDASVVTSIVVKPNESSVLINKVSSITSSALSLIGEVSSSGSTSGDAEVEQITNNAQRRSSPQYATSTPNVETDQLHSNDAQFNLNFNQNSNETSSLQEALRSSMANNGSGKPEIDGTCEGNRQHSRDLSSSPTIMLSNTKFSKETIVNNSNQKQSSTKKRKPRKLSRSEIITLAEHTNFQDDSSSSFEDNHSYSSFTNKREKSFDEGECILGKLPFKKIGLKEFSNSKKEAKATMYTVEVVEIKPPSASPVTIQKSEEDSQHSNRSYSYGYASSPQTPLFVSNYVEVKTNDADITPNTSFNLIDSIKENLLLNSESTSSTSMKEITNALEEGEILSTPKKKRSRENVVTPKKKSKKKKEDIRNIKITDQSANNNKKHNDKKKSPVIVNAKSPVRSGGPLKRRKEKKNTTPRKKIKSGEDTKLSSQVTAKRKSSNQNKDESSNVVDVQAGNESPLNEVKEKKIITPKKSQRIKDDSSNIVDVQAEKESPSNRMKEKKIITPRKSQRIKDDSSNIVDVQAEKESHSNEMKEKKIITPRKSQRIKDDSSNMVDLQAEKENASNEVKENNIISPRKSQRIYDRQLKEVLSPSKDYEMALSLQASPSKSSRKKTPKKSPGKSPHKPRSEAKKVKGNDMMYNTEPFMDVIKIREALTNDQTKMISEGVDVPSIVEDCEDTSMQADATLLGHESCSTITADMDNTLKNGVNIDVSSHTTKSNKKSRSVGKSPRKGKPVKKRSGNNISTTLDESSKINASYFGLGPKLCTEAICTDLSSSSNSRCISRGYSSVKLKMTDGSLETKSDSKNVSEKLCSTPVVTKRSIDSMSHIQTVSSKNEQLSVKNKGHIIGKTARHCPVKDKKIKDDLGKMEGEPRDPSFKDKIEEDTTKTESCNFHDSVMNKVGKTSFERDNIAQTVTHSPSSVKDKNHDSSKKDGIVIMHDDKSPTSEKKQKVDNTDKSDEILKSEKNLNDLCQGSDVDNDSQSPAAVKSKKTDGSLEDDIDGEFDVNSSSPVDDIYEGLDIQKISEKVQNELNSSLDLKKQSTHGDNKKDKHASVREKNPSRSRKSNNDCQNPSSLKGKKTDYTHKRDVASSGKESKHDYYKRNIVSERDRASTKNKDMYGISKSHTSKQGHHASDSSIKSKHRRDDSSSKSDIHMKRDSRYSSSRHDKHGSCSKYDDKRIDEDRKYYREDKYPKSSSSGRSKCYVESSKDAVKDCSTSKNSSQQNNHVNCASSKEKSGIKLSLKHSINSVSCKRNRSSDNLSKNSCHSNSKKRKTDSSNGVEKESKILTNNKCIDSHKSVNNIEQISVENGVVSISDRTKNLPVKNDIKTTSTSDIKCRTIMHNSKYQNNENPVPQISTSKSSSKASAASWNSCESNIALNSEKGLGYHRKPDKSFPNLDKSRNKSCKEGNHKNISLEIKDSKSSVKTPSSKGISSQSRTRSKIDVKTYLSRSGKKSSNTDVCKSNKEKGIKNVEQTKPDDYCSESDSTCAYVGSPEDPRIKTDDIEMEGNSKLLPHCPPSSHIQIRSLNTQIEPGSIAAISPSDLSFSCTSISSSDLTFSYSKIPPSYTWTEPVSSTVMSSYDAVICSNLSTLSPRITREESVCSTSISVSNDYNYSNLSAPSPQIPLRPSRESWDVVNCLNDDFSYSNMSAPSPQIPLPANRYKSPEHDELSSMTENTQCSSDEVRTPSKGDSVVSSDVQCSPKWTQHEDGIILTTLMQMDGDEEKTQDKLPLKMPNRSSMEIRKRMEYLKEHLYTTFGISSGGESDDADDDTDSQESS